MFRNTTIFAMYLYLNHLPDIYRPDRTEPEVRGRTGATPLICRSFGKQGKVSEQVSEHHLSLAFGVAPVRLIPTGRLRTRITSGR